MDEAILLARIRELHGMWWEVVWDEIAWDEHNREPADFALTIRVTWDRFIRVAKAFGFDPKALVTEFEAKGDPKMTTAADYAAMAEKARCS
jgi:hypothetical protein